MKRQWLAEIRIARGETQQSVADSAGMSQSGYADIERGAKNPSIAAAKHIAAALDFDWTRFFEEPTADPVEDTA